jgi:hypothetical protein
MNERRFQPSVLAFIYPKQKPGAKSYSLASGNHDDPFGDWTQRFWPLLLSSFVSQMTTDRDPAFISIGAFGVRE